MNRPYRILLGICLSAVPIAAQEGVGDGARTTLTLAEALEIARENNPTYRIARSDLETAATLDRSTWTAFLPTVSLSIGTGISQSRNFTGQDEFGRPVRREDPVVYTSSSSSQTVGMGQVTLFDGGQKLAGARGDHARAEALRAGVEAASVELRVRLTRRYQAAVAAEREIALNQRTLASAREALEGTQRLLRIGRTDPLDLLGAELQVAEREHALERARGASRAARLALGDEMGLGREIDGDLVDDLPNAFDPAALDVDRIVASAMESSPTLGRLGAAATAAEHQLGAARGRRWPSVTLSGSTGRRIGRTGSEALFELNPLDQSYGVNLSFSLPLFDQHQTSDAITRARLDRFAAEENLRAGRIQTESRIRGAVIDLENAYRDIQLAERSADLSRQRLELAEQKFELGGISFDDLRNASDDAFAREHAVLNARHDFAAALLALEEAVGGPVR
jgi:outer membrane protein TolC